MYRKEGKWVEELPGVRIGEKDRAGRSGFLFKI